MDWFEQGLWKAKTRLKSYAMRLVGNIDDADDAVQHTFMQAVANRGSFVRGTNLDAWLTTILKNHVKTRWKRKDNGIEFTGEPNYADHIPAASDPERNVIVMQGFDAISRLPDDMKYAVVQLGLGMTYTALAAEIGVCDGTVKSRGHRARLKLHDMVGAL